MESIHPFLKWAGGKFKLIDKITHQFPTSYHSRYIEPFLGAGAVALNVVDFPVVIVNDINPDLILVWKALRDIPEQVIEQCENLFLGTYNNARDYYALRKEFNDWLAMDARQAALFIYLNKHGFNGLCRYNRRGEFNVPFGKYATVGFDANKLREIARKIRNQKWVITNTDYTHTMLLAARNDIVYCDPPFVTDDQVKTGFTAYSKNAFGLSEQDRLAQEAQAAAKRGAFVIISNHDTAYTRELYTHYGGQLVFFDVQRNISCNGQKRHKATELLAVFRPKEKIDFSSDDPSEYGENDSFA